MDTKVYKSKFGTYLRSLKLDEYLSITRIDLPFQVYNIQYVIQVLRTYSVETFRNAMKMYAVSFTRRFMTQSLKIEIFKCVTD